MKDPKGRRRRAPRCPACRIAQHGVLKVTVRENRHWSLAQPQPRQEQR